MKAVEAFCKLNRHWGDKPKRVVDYVTAHDHLLGEMLRDYFARGQNPRHAFEIADHVLAPFGGRLATFESTKVKYPGGA